MADTTQAPLPFTGETDESQRSTTMPVIRPALPARVELSLTIVYFVMFALLFVLVYAQLWMIWHYRHKRLSHQTLFLFLCLVWAGLRTTLFSFYFFNCSLANDLPVVVYWLLYSFPVCLQFSMLCLLLHFFAQIVIKSRAKYESGQYKIPLRVFLCFSVLVFTAFNAAFAWLTRSREMQLQSSSFIMLTVRVILTEAMFFVYGCCLSFCIYRMAKTTSTHRVLEAKGTTVGQALMTCLLITLLFLSRAVYNVVSICPTMKKSTPTFGYDWINVTDQADAVVGDLSHGLAYVSFGVVLFLWEVLPISMVVIFFRVRRLHMGHVPTDFSQQQNGSRVFFFDNPRRYDSEDDLSHQSSSSPYREIGVRHSLNGEATSRSWTPRVTPHGTPSSWSSSGQQQHPQQHLQQQQPQHPYHHVTAAVVHPQARHTSGSGARWQGEAGSGKRHKYGSFDEGPLKVHGTAEQNGHW